MFERGVIRLHREWRVFLLLCIICSNLPAISASKFLKKSRYVNLKPVRIHSEELHATKLFNKVFDNKLHKVRYFGDSVIVKFKKGISNEAIQKYLARHELVVKNKLNGRTYALELASIKSTEDKEKSLEIQSKVYSLLNHEGENLLSDPVDTIDFDEYKKVVANRVNLKGLAGRQWHLDNDGSNGLLPGADLNIKNAWAYSQGKGIKVAVIDTGFDLGHPDINYAENGYDVVDGDNKARAPLNSAENHGTAVAGIIAGKDDGKGVVGVAPKSQIIPIRLISFGGFVSVSQIVKAFTMADRLGAQIINNSWGSYDPDLAANDIMKLSQTEDRLYTHIAENGNDGKGILIFFASGNSGRSNFNASPEARHASTVAIGATNSLDRRAPYSVYGEELDLVAPGGGSVPIYTTDRRDRRGGKPKVRGYSKGNYAKNFKGTSAACPMAAGVAALIWSYKPYLSAEQVKEILFDSANKNISSSYKFDDDGKNPELGYGRIDAGSALDLAASSY